MDIPIIMPVITEKISSTQQAYEIKKRIPIPSQHFQMRRAGFLFVVRVQGGNTGHVKIYDKANAQTLAEQSYTNSGYQEALLELLNLPPKGTNTEFEIQLYVETSGNIDIRSGSIVYS